MSPWKVDVSVPSRSNPRAIVHIFESKEDLERDGNAQYHIEVSYVEIYNEEIRDLLNPDGNKKLEIKGNSGAIQG